MGDEDHDCAWKAHAQDLSAQLEKLQAEMAAMKRHVYGKRSEKMPPMAREVKRDQSTDADAVQATRSKNAELKSKQLKTETVDVPVEDSKRQCPKCRSKKLKTISSTKPTSITEYVPGYFRKRIYNREKLVCNCGKHVVTAAVPDKVFEKTQYGPGFMAYLAIAKTLDCVPLYRLEKAFKRSGVPISRSTMNTLYHRVGNALGIVAQRIMAQVAASDIVLADETTLQTQEQSDKKHYVWTFISGKNIGYRFSLGRSGQTPRDVLGSTRGTLVVDAYTGYNAVLDVDGRVRAACLAHVRRKFFDAQSNAPEMATPLELIRQIYIVEHRAREPGISGTEDHTRLRQAEALPILDKLHAWLLDNQKLHPPRSNAGKAIRHALNNWQALGLFINDARIPPDNNASERALRVVALGRKNFLFVRNRESGENLANLYTVLATCEAHGINPQLYLSDILTRLDSTTTSQIDQLLPANWTPASP